MLGRTILVNRRELTVVDVAPPEFSGTVRGLTYDMWVPLMAAIDEGESRNRQGRPY